MPIFLSCQVTTYVLHEKVRVVTLYLILDATMLASDVAYADGVTLITAVET